MKKRWIAVGALGALVVTGAVLRFAFPQQTVAWAAKRGIPGFIGELRNPIADYHPVQWQKGPATAPTGERPPNVILIVADVLGYNDLTWNGGGIANGTVPTPNIDALAREGVDFTQGYAGNATCSPSRAAMVTGRYPTRFGFEFTGIPPSFAAPVSHGAGNSPGPVVFREDLNHDVIPSWQMRRSRGRDQRSPKGCGRGAITAFASGNGIWVRAMRWRRMRKVLTRRLASGLAGRSSCSRMTRMW